MRTGLHILDGQAAEDKAKLDWLRAATQEAFAALDRGEGIALHTAEDIYAFVDRAIAEARAERAGTHA